MSGPVPKRSDERIRRNVPDVPIEKLEIQGAVEVPDLDMPNAHPLVLEIWESLKESGQAKYFEPSDWTFAKFTLHFANKLLKSPRPSANMLTTVHSMFGDLLVSEGQRRKVRLEIERKSSEPTQVFDAAAMFAARAAGN